MKVKIDAKAWAKNEKVEAVVAVPAKANPPQYYKFILEGRSEVVIAVVTDEGTKIDIQPDRSASHRALRDALGV